jgi:hypothetical protein
MTGCSAVPEIQLSQHDPMLHEVVPTENAVIPPVAPHLVVPTMSPTITSGLFPLKVHAEVQQEFIPPFCVDPSSQSSPTSTTPSPQLAAAGDAKSIAQITPTRIVKTGLIPSSRTAGHLRKYS